jgi:hypothetical protein
MGDTAPCAEIAIGHALHDFFQALDERRYDDQVGHLTPAGTWLRQGKLLTGPDEMRAALEERPADFHTAHVISNLVARPAAGEARATFLATVFAHRGDRPKGGHLPVTPAQIARYQAILVEELAGWRIRSLESTILFKA